ncbi:HNH endonuclease signature motif containing protein [Staphylococcus chromogenes]|nr:HNH endonuclease signature motif containing protein [Staphylococcus chromogenes]
MIDAAKRLLERALESDLTFDSFGDLLEIKELVARLETELARGREVYELEEAGASRTAARRMERRASFAWRDDVPVEPQDLILSALEKLSGASKRREEIYELAADAAQNSSPRQTHEYVKRLVREENQRLAKDPHEAFRQRRFTMRNQDEYGGCTFYGYAPPATAALLKALLDRSFHVEQPADVPETDLRTIPQRQLDAFTQILKWASSDRVAITGHVSLVASVTDGDTFDWRAKFATNVGIDLNLFDIAHLSDDRVVDYIVVHDHNGAVKNLVTAERSANFYQRVALMARDLVCQHPGCDAPASRCDAHHVQPWGRGGPTDISNLALVCRRHHRRIDDSYVEQHMEMMLKRPVWIYNCGRKQRNTSPAATRSGGWRVADPCP